MKPKPFSEHDKSAINMSYSYNPETGVISHKLERNGNGGKVQVGDHAGSMCKDGYIIISLNSSGRQVLAHRVAWFLATGICPGSMQIDHIDHNRSNNRLSNLRLVDTLGNKKNESMRKDNTSGFTGVSLQSKNQKWIAYYYKSGKRITIGEFLTKEDAIAARSAANSNAGFHENHGKPKLKGASRV